MYSKNKTCTERSAHVFWGWIAGLGDKVVITGLDHVLQEYTEHLQKILDLYENNK